MDKSKCECKTWPKPCASIWDCIREAPSPQRSIYEGDIGHLIFDLLKMVQNDQSYNLA